MSESSPYDFPDLEQFLFLLRTLRWLAPAIMLWCWCWSWKFWQWFVLIEQWYLSRKKNNIMNRKCAGILMISINSRSSSKQIRYFNRYMKRGEKEIRSKFFHVLFRKNMTGSGLQNELVSYWTRSMLEWRLQLNRFILVSGTTWCLFLSTSLGL